MAFLVVGYVMSGIPDPNAGTTSDRYMVPLVFGLASVLPVWATGTLWKRSLVAAGCGLLVAVGLVPLATAKLATQREAAPHAREASSVAAWVRSRSADVGYSDYWDSLSLTYHTGLTVRAVERCTTSTATLCPKIINTRRGWYWPTGAIRTFLVVNPTFGDGLKLQGIETASDLGTPLESRQFGPIQVYIYDYDVARWLGGRGANAESVP